LNYNGFYFKVGLKKLTKKERTVLTVIAEFCKKKNFLATLKTSGSVVKEKDLLNWLDSNFFKSKEMIDQMRCDFCNGNIRVDLCNSLGTVECDAGHKMNRCQRSLLPLNCNEFKSCLKCKVCWNLMSDGDYPNLCKLYKNKNKCLFCN